MRWNPPASPPNLVVIFLESFRAKEVGACGSGLGLTPVLDRLASGGWVWKNFYANGIQTWRAAVSALSGVYTADWAPDSEMDQNDPAHPLRGLAEILRENGYDTEYWSGSSLEYGNQRVMYDNLGYGLLCGKEDLYNRSLKIYGWGLADHVLLEMVADRLNARPPGRPLHALVLTSSSHHPFVNPLSPDTDVGYASSPPAADLPRKYREIVSYVDGSLGKMIARLSPTALSRTVFVLVGDHGVALGENGRPPSLYARPADEYFRVPLVIYAPALSATPAVLEEVGSHVDLLPTLLDLLGLPAVNHAVGRSLLSAPPAPEENMAYFDNGFWRVLRVGDYAYMGELGVFSSPEGGSRKGTLHHAVRDPHLAVDLSRDLPALASMLHSRISAIAESKQALWKSSSFGIWPPLRTPPSSWERQIEPSDGSPRVRDSSPRR